MFLWHQNGVCCCLACASRLRRSYDQEWVVSHCNQAKKAQQYLLCGTNRRNRPHHFHALVEIQRDWRTPIARLLGEPPRDPNQSSAPPVIDHNRLTPGEAKEIHLLSLEYFWGMHYDTVTLAHILCSSNFVIILAKYIFCSSDSC